MRIGLFDLMVFWMMNGVSGDNSPNHTSSSDQQPPPDFAASFSGLGINFTSQVAEFNYTINTPGATSNLLFCQTIADPDEELNPENTYKISNIGSVCVSSTNSTATCGTSGIKSVLENATIIQQFTIIVSFPDTLPNSFANFFACLTSYDGGPCVTYSSAFTVGNYSVPDIANNKDQQSLNQTTLIQFLFPTIPVTYRTNSTALPGNVVISDILSPGVVPVTTIIGATMTAGALSSLSTTAGTIEDTTPLVVKSLPIGAKIGIALGAIAVLLFILLIALFSLKRRHRQRETPDQVMLHQSTATDSHDLINEKEIAVESYDTPSPAFGSPGSPSSLERHSALAPYDMIPSQPYNGSAASIPRRKPASSAAESTVIVTGGAGVTVIGASTLSREASSASSMIPTPKRTSTASTGESADDRSYKFEEYHDVPVYGNVRHSAIVFQETSFANESAQGGGISTGTGESMSESERERLEEEEEERRIDAAIEEAERSKNMGLGIAR